IGWIEVRDPSGGPWRPYKRIGEFVGRSYDMFGCLFGVTNFARFRPVAAGRGLPPDVSKTVAREATTLRPGFLFFRRAQTVEEYHSHSWLSLRELAAIDWDEPADAADARLHRYERTPEGELVFAGKASYDWRLAERLGPDYTPLAVRS